MSMLDATVVAIRTSVIDMARGMISSGYWDQTVVYSGVAP